MTLGIWLRKMSQRFLAKPLARTKLAKLRRGTSSTPSFFYPSHQPNLPPFFLPILCETERQFVFPFFNRFLVSLYQILRQDSCPGGSYNSQENQARKLAVTIEYGMCGDTVEKTKVWESNRFSSKS